jgi:hypothetical protein
MMLKGQNTRLIASVATWRRCASFGIACPSAPSLGAIMLGGVNTIGGTKSAEHRFSDYLRRQI